MGRSEGGKEVQNVLLEGVSLWLPGWEFFFGDSFGTSRMRFVFEIFTVWMFFFHSQVTRLFSFLWVAGQRLGLEEVVALVQRALESQSFPEAPWRVPSGVFFGSPWEGCAERPVESQGKFTVFTWGYEGQSGVQDWKIKGLYGCPRAENTSIGEMTHKSPNAIQTTKHRWTALKHLKTLVFDAEIAQIDW